MDIGMDMGMDTGMDTWNEGNKDKPEAGINRE